VLEQLTNSQTQHICTDEYPILHVFEGRILVRTAQTPPLSNTGEQWSTENFAWLAQSEKHSIYSSILLLLPYSSEYLSRCEWVWSRRNSRDGRWGRKDVQNGGGGACLPCPLIPPPMKLYFRPLQVVSWFLVDCLHHFQPKSLHIIFTAHVQMLHFCNPGVKA